MQRISRLNRVLRLSASTAAIAAASGPAMAQLAGGNTLGGMATRIAQDSRRSGARSIPSSRICSARRSSSTAVMRSTHTAVTRTANTRRIGARSPSWSPACCSPSTRSVISAPRRSPAAARPRRARTLRCSLSNNAPVAARAVHLVFRVGRAAGKPLPLLRLHFGLARRLCSAGWSHRVRALSGIVASLVRYRRAGDGADLVAWRKPGGAELSGPRRPSHVPSQRRGGAHGEQAVA